MAKDFLPKLITFFRLDEHVRRLKLSHEELEIRVETIEDAPSGVGIESISGDYVDNTDPLNPVVLNQVNYKILRGIINIGSDETNNITTFTILDNTLENTVPFVWSRESTGQYKLTSAGAFVGTLLPGLVLVEGNNKYNISKLNNNEILLINREIDSFSTVANLTPSTNHRFELILY